MPLVGRLAEREFDVDSSWALDPRVSVRPEPFGALLYHFGTRRLSFLKDPRLRVVVTELEHHGTARSACLAAGVTDLEMPQFTRALARLAECQMLRPIDGDAVGSHTALQGADGP